MPTGRQEGFNPKSSNSDLAQSSHFVKAITEGDKAELIFF